MSSFSCLFQEASLCRRRQGQCQHQRPCSRTHKAMQFSRILTVGKRRKPTFCWWLRSWYQVESDDFLPSKRNRRSQRKKGSMSRLMPFILILLQLWSMQLCQVELCLFVPVLLCFVNKTCYYYPGLKNKHFYPIKTCESLSFTSTLNSSEKKYAIKPFEFYICSMTLTRKIVQ